MTITVENDWIFCVDCGEQNDMKNNNCVACKKILLHTTDDYCCVCGCEQ